MAIIKCPDCGKDVSTSADNCPHCGYPIAGGGTTQAHGGRVQTIEKTGKPFKLQMLLAFFLMLAGCLATVFVLFVGGYYYEPEEIFHNMPGILSFGIFLFVAGLIWYIIVRFAAWWQHG